MSQLLAVDSLDDVEDSRRLTDLVGLKMTDQVPFEPGAPYRWDLALGLLDAVLTEKCLSQLRSLDHAFRREGLGDSQNSNR